MLKAPDIGSAGMTSTVAVCRSCGTPPYPGSRFCHECGSALTKAPIAAEYKQVTVLFADVVRSGAIAAAVDIERLRGIMSDIVERSAAVVRRYGGTVEYNGDGVMALFGAPVALEDHAFRGCLAALAIQEEASHMAEEVRRRDGLELRVRVGLNSGRVIAGEIGSISLGYRATGETVVLAQRIESAAAPGGVLLSESTARLVESRTVLAEPEWVPIKGSDDPVCVRRLVAARPRSVAVGHATTRLVGRRPEITTLGERMQRAAAGHGGVVGLVGQPGVGKSRAAREVAEMADDGGIDVLWVFCGSRAAEVPFRVVAQLLRGAFGVAALNPVDARARLRAGLPDADHEDVLLLDDLLGISDPDVVAPVLDPDARRRRLTALVNTASVASARPTVVIIEDVHWIDVVSESMIVGFLSVVATTPSMVLITARPEYQGPLMRLPDTQTLTLGPLDDVAAFELIGALLGSDPSVVGLVGRIAERSRGNPFFVHELVREMAQRGVLTGEEGAYACSAPAAEVIVPATVEAAIESRIDRLSVGAKQTLNAAAVIGTRFDGDLLAALGFDADVPALLDANLLDLVDGVEYSFHHPLIRAVAYESQLKSDRAEWHRRVAVVLQQRAAESTDDSAALIAEHFELAGIAQLAYQWQMRAAAWLTNRDVTAARRSWERARHIAAHLPDDDPAKVSLQIAPLAMLCATDFHARAAQESRGRFDELRDLCSAAGDKVSLAIGMTGRVGELLYSGRATEAAQLASEQMVLLESIGNPTLTAGLGFVAFACWYDAGDFEQMLQWSQTVIELCDGDPTKGAEFGFGSPLAAALAFRGVAGWTLGHPGWREDLRGAVEIAQGSDSTTLAYILAWTYALEFAHGVLRADEPSIAVMDAAVAAAERRGDDNAVMLAEYGLGVALFFAASADDRERAERLLAATIETLRERTPSLVPPTEVWLGAQVAKRDRGAALPVMRRAVDELFRTNRVGYCVFTTATLVQTLLESESDSDISEAEVLMQRLADMGAAHDSAILRITLLRLRALLAGARGDRVAYFDLVAHYREMAESLDFDGHLAWAQTLAGGHALRNTSTGSSRRA